LRISSGCQPCGEVVVMWFGVSERLLLTRRQMHLGRQQVKADEQWAILIIPAIYPSLPSFYSTISRRSLTHSQTVYVSTCINLSRKIIIHFDYFGTHQVYQNSKRILNSRASRFGLKDLYLELLGMFPALTVLLFTDDHGLRSLTQRPSFRCRGLNESRTPQL